MSHKLNFLFKKEKITIFLILFLALVFRIIAIDQSLWLDEAISVVYAKSSDFWWYVSVYPKGDFHPQGYFVILWIWGHIFGFSEFSVRIPSVLFGVGTVYIAYKLGVLLFSKTVGIFGALLLAFAPLHIYYSQEARMYGFATFALALSYFFLLKSLKDGKYWLGYMISVAIVFYSDYVAYFGLVGQIVYVCCFFRDRLFKFIKWFGLSVLLFIPGIWVLPNQLLGGVNTANLIVGWRNVVGGIDIKDMLLLPIKILVGRVGFENKLLYFIVLIFAFIPYFLSFSKVTKSIKDKSVVLMILWIILSIFIAYFVSLFIPVFSYFRLLYVVVPIYLLVALGLTLWPKKIAFFLIFIILSCDFVFWGMYVLTPNFKREDWRTAVTIIDQEAGDNTVKVVLSNESLAPITYYSKKNDYINGLTNIPAKSENDVINLEKFSEYKRVYLFEYLKEIADINGYFINKLEIQGFREVKIYNFDGVGLVRVYEKYKN